MADKIKIALIIRGFHNGGIEKVFENFYSHMNMENYEIHIITNMDNIPARVKIFEEMGCVIHPLSKMKGHRIKWRNIAEYRNLFRNEHFDVVHNNVPDNLLPLYFAKKYGVPVRILHAHNMYTEGYSQKNKLIAAIYIKGFALNTENATKLIAVSKKAADAAFGIRSRDALILKNAIDLEKFAFNQNARSKIRQHLRIDDKTILFGHVGRYEDNQKNQEFVLHLFKKVLEKYENCRLVMIGSGTRLEEFKEMAVQLDVEKYVTFTGAISNVNEYFSAMDIYLFPSRKEGLPVAGVEAQASGVRCIFSDKIPEETYITKELKVMEIDGAQAIDRWMKGIEDIIPDVLNSNKNNRTVAVEQVRIAGFDISMTANLLYNLYSS